MKLRGNYRWTSSLDGVQSLGLDGRTPFSLLIGSGVSVATPSCLPTGHEFTRALLSEIVPLSELPAILAMTGVQDPAGRGRLIRFEQIVQLVSEVDPELRVLDILDDREPNANHIALARLAMAGRRLLTTNFDVLLERALLTMAPATLVRPVISEEEWLAPPEGVAYPVYKLHGSILNTATGDRTQESIQATLRQIARNKKLGVDLEPFKRELFTACLRGEDLVVVGYSGLDDFDIMPVLQKTESARRIIWIEHVGGIHAKDAEVLSLVPGPENTDPDRVGNFLRSLAGLVRRPEDLFRVRVDTMELLTELSGAAPETPHPEQTPRLVTQIALNLSEARKAFFAGEIYAFGYADKALPMFRRASDLARSDGDRMLESQCLVYMARQNEAFLLLHGKTKGEVEVLWRAVKADLEAAGRILETIPGKESREWSSTVLNNLGVLYRHRGLEGDLEEARGLFLRALAIDREIGDLAGEAGRLNNLAAVDYSLGRLDAAIDACARACELDEALGDLHELAAHLSNLGKFRCDAGQEEGVALLLQAIELGMKLGTLDQVANAYNSLGRYHADHRQFREALDAYELAVEFAEGEGMAIADSFRRSANVVRKAMDAGSIYEKVQELALEGDGQGEPARLDPFSITGLVVLVPAGLPISDDQVATFMIGCYRQLNVQLSASLAEKSLWTGLEMGYLACPPDFPNGLIGLAYMQATEEQGRGKTVLIQGPIPLSQKMIALGFPAEIFILTVAGTPVEQEPMVGFVPKGSIAPTR